MPKTKAELYVSDDPKEAARQWLFYRSRAGFWGGYPVGGSYIDARFRRVPESAKLHVVFDKAFAGKHPRFAGRYYGDIEYFLKHGKLPRKMQP